MKRYVLSALVMALTAASLVVMDTGKVQATASSRAIGPLGPGLIYAAGTEGADSILSVFVRAGSNWYAGITNIDGKLAIVPTGTLTTPPFIVNFGDHNTAFVNTPVIYDGQDAMMIMTFQDWTNDSLDNATIIILSADYSKVFKVVYGPIQGTLSVQP